VFGFVACFYFVHLDLKAVRAITMRKVDVPTVFEIGFDPHPGFLIVSHFSADRTNGYYAIKLGYLTDVLNHKQRMRPLLEEKGRSGD